MSPDGGDSTDSGGGGGGGESVYRSYHHHLLPHGKLAVVLDSSGVDIIPCDNSTPNICHNNKWRNKHGLWVCAVMLTNGDQNYWVVSPSVLTHYTGCEMVA